MELRQYWAVLRRHWWLIALLPALAAAFTLLTYEEPPVTYGYVLQYSVSFIPSEDRNFEQDPVLSAVQASEYVADDLTEILRGSTFASYVQQHLDEPLPPGSLAEVARTNKVHRLVSLTLMADTEARVAAIGQAYKQAIEQELQQLLNELWGIGRMRLELVNDSGAFSMGGSLRSQLDIPLRMALALIAAVAIAFLLDFLDDSVRSRDEAERLVGPVLAEIPTGKGSG